ncbi:uncharacterized protein [Diadema antillarum]|uniref:uncharacterized protein n=1 Tax=Diadema antillarum TaxID=105358 RepID=UPI003A8A1B6D
MQEILPGGYQYHLCNIIEEIPGPNYSFVGSLRVNISTEEEAKQWVIAFEKSSLCTWRVLRTFKTCGRYVTFKKSYRCHHNTRPSPGANANRKTQSKNTSCPTTFTVTVKNTVPVTNKLSRNKTDVHLQGFPTVILFNYNHNHNLQCAGALKYRDVSQETKDTLIDLFHRKYGPTAALEALKYELQVKHPNYYKVAADRSVCPDIQYCCRLYQKIFKANYGESNDGEGMVRSLQDLAKQFNAASGKMAVDITEDNQVIAAICTPLMQRVHRLHKYSGELCFMDASSNMDRHNCKVFMLLTHSCVGGLPIGVLITTAETQPTITAALRLFTTILPSGSFSGRGVVGPQLFITDDCMAERRALQDVFPQSTLLLCSFHLLQATWRWLWSAAHNIPLKDRPEHLRHMRRMIFATSSQEADELFASSMADPELHKSFKDYLQSAYSRKSQWACLYRTELPLRGNLTNNYCESAMRLLKDRVLSRTKAFNIAQLADFLSSHLQDYYERRILDVANGRLGDVLSSKSMVNPVGISKQHVTRISETDFKVLSQSKADTEYHIDMQVGCCSCYKGRTGGPCKHQAAVVKYHSAPSLNFVPLADVKAKELLYRIATGGDSPEPGRFAGLQTEAATETSNMSEVTPPLPPAHVPQDSQEQSSTDDSTATSSTAVTDVKAQLKSEIFDAITAKIDLYPTEFVPAAEAMLKQCRQMKTDSQWVSAMNTFGKYSGVAAAFNRVSGKKRSLQLTSSQIGVQPTATARRRPHMGRGKRHLGCGRPSKKSGLSDEHGYARQQVHGSSTVLPVPRKKRCAPHSLGYCVDMNISLGKTHSTK